MQNSGLRARLLETFAIEMTNLITSDSVLGTSIQEAARAVATRVDDRSPLIHHLNQIELSRRWRVSPRTLERWRWLRQGPAFCKIMGRVVYRLEDVEAFEIAQRCKCGAAPEATASVSR
jgi:hypothetical protein